MVNSARLIVLVKVLVIKIICNIYVLSEYLYNWSAIFFNPLVR